MIVFLFEKIKSTFYTTENDFYFDYKKDITRKITITMNFKIGLIIRSRC
jgi:hypothetical protein